MANSVNKRGGTLAREHTNKREILRSGKKRKEKQQSHILFSFSCETKGARNVCKKNYLLLRITSFVYSILSQIRQHFPFSSPSLSVSSPISLPSLWPCTLNYARKRKINYKLIWKSVWIQVRKKADFFPHLLSLAVFWFSGKLPRWFLEICLKRALLLCCLGVLHTCKSH